MKKPILCCVWYLLLSLASFGQQAGNQLLSKGVTQKSSVEFRVGRGFGPIRFPREVRQLEQAFNAAIVHQVNDAVSVGVYGSYQERWGSFVFYRLNNGLIRPERYLIGAQHTSMGVKLRLSLNGVLEQALNRSLPSWLSIYQSYYGGLIVTQQLVPEEVYANGVIFGFGIDQGASDFFSYEEDVIFRPGLMTGAQLSIPRTPISVFAEGGYGPLAVFNTGVSLRIQYVRQKQFRQNKR